MYRKGYLAQKIAQFLALLLMGIQVGVSFSHFMQAPGKLKLPPDVYIWVQDVLISYQSKLGIVEVGTLLATIVTLFLVQKNRKVFWLTLIGLLCMITMLGVWFWFIRPINQQVDTWTVKSLPSNWKELRIRWHELHYIRLVLAIVGMSMLILSILMDTSPIKRKVVNS